MRQLKKLTDLIIYSNLLISFGAAAFIWETYLMYRLPVQPLYILIGFASTVFTYNVDRLIALYDISQITGSERHDWINTKAKFLGFLSAASFIFLAVAVWFLPWKVIIFLGHIGFISVAYSVPFFGKNNFTLRSVKGLKIFLITYVWTASTVMFPILGAGHSIFTRDVLLLCIERALFIFAITLPFDIRDYESDRRTNVVTIPGWIGIKATKALAFVCLLIFFLVNLVHYDFHSGVLWAKLISGISTFIIVLFADDKRHEYYFTGLLDGTIIIQFLLVLAMYQMTF